VIYPRVDGIPRFVPASFYALNMGNDSIQEKTKNYFGFEWDYFRDWGFVRDGDVPAGQARRFYGGTTSARRATFDSKCRLDASDLASGKIVLDAGCGNGRYSYEAASRTDALIIGVDIGYGSVLSAMHNTRELSNVLIMQADLFNLPFKSGVVDSCFSNGVLMHTGDAAQAFREVARTLVSGGVFVAHVYNKLNPIWELNDRLLRMITTRLSVQQNLNLARVLSDFAMRIENRNPEYLRKLNYFFKLLPTLHHMYDWYAAPVASHHSYDELAEWFRASGFRILDKESRKEHFWRRPWACNIKGVKVIES
jgi:SAM-dependent methyltransferase